MSGREDILLKKMIEKSEEAFLIYDIVEGRFVYVNASFETITKRSRDLLFSDPSSFLDVIHPEDEALAKKVFKHLLRKKTSTRLDFRIVRPDHTERWIRLKTYPLLRDQKIEFITGILEDDSARKASILNMQKINGWKDSILEILAHDLRGPISMVKMLASAIDQQLEGNDNKEIQKWTRMIEEISRRNIELIHTLVKRESLDTAGVAVNKERIDLVREIAEVMKIYDNAQKSAQKYFEFTHSHEAIYGQVDSMRFLQIINNLVSNAIKFTPAGGIIKVHIEKLETSALITVSDNGIGIPQHLQGKIFNKYTEAGRRGLDGQEPIGLGMWIVKSFTEAHGGNVWLESEEGKGTSVYVEIPRGYEEFEEHD